MIDSTYPSLQQVNCYSLNMELSLLIPKPQGTGAKIIFMPDSYMKAALLEFF